MFSNYESDLWVNFSKYYCTQTSAWNSDEGFILYVFRFWMEHSDILEILIQQGRSDIIFNSFINNASIILKHLASNYDLGLSNKTSERDYHYFIAVRAGVFVGLFHVWIDHNKKETAEELTQIIKEQLVVMNQSGYIF